MTASDYISLTSLFFTLLGIPIGYYLGCRSARHAKYNELIDNLENINQKVLELFLDIYHRNNFEISDYHLMVAYHKKIQRHSYELKVIGKFKEFSDLNRLLLELKKILTNKLFSEKLDVKQQALSELVIKLDAINCLYPKKFF
ncbi:hypothetical protein A9G28_09755 [Gilliamella sp. Fer1-1]|jgi:hypothetical protein|uniref:hypothetical protein n=1 Tax=Gilliamella sp. Fer1-1 TaxID=3120240 RepID=UPI00080E4026|nr:hypothetical protein [Gilliamella apicola]OCG39336.1 hypothetical protein A9G28_09755 [Gilliamella apicola]